MDIEGLARLLNISQERFNYNAFLRELHNWSLATDVTDSDAVPKQEEGEDYRAEWEDAFLLSGFENGKYSFLTAFVALSIKRHGFTTATQRNPDANAVITHLHFKGENVIPDKDAAGNPVIIGVTDPRTYLPKEIQIILDDEFGYDRDVYDPHR